MRKKKELEALKPLDLARCHTVGEIVEAMRHCSFGARMLGEVAAKLCTWAEKGRPPIIVYDGYKDTPLCEVLKGMVARKWAKSILRPEAYALNRGLRSENILVVGPYSERHEVALGGKADSALFINQYDMAPPGTVMDGYFPNVVFSDPRFVMPVLYATMRERLSGERETAAEMVGGWLGNYGGLASDVADGAQTLHAMVSDKECSVFFTASGAMTIAKMGLIICDLIDHGMVRAVFTTGALMAHGLIESVGLKHYKFNPAHEDAMLADRGLNRVTDTLEPETNFDHIEKVVGTVFSGMRGIVGSSDVHARIGKYLADTVKGRGILKSAYLKNVPVFVPAFEDSELGNDLFTHNYERKKSDRLIVNHAVDTKRMIDIAVGAKKLGIFSIGGGVPRNNAQNIAPLIHLLNARRDLSFPQRQFSYGCKIAPDKMHFGHLGGCSYSEGMSWLKFSKDAHISSVQADATLVLPFMAKYLSERM